MKMTKEQAIKILIDEFKRQKNLNGEAFSLPSNFKEAEETLGGRFSEACQSLYKNVMSEDKKDGNN